jgi:serine/threonine-protein kinase
VDSKENRNPGAVTRIGKYEIVGELGRGGMGVVYRGIDRQLGRAVAIKTLTEGISNDADMLARFYDEGRKTGSFKHPNIVTVYELGEEQGVPYIAMELVDGDPLDKLIHVDEHPPMVECLRIIEELCSALAYAHRSNVIHRDVKPANIFVQPDGRVKLLDFGIARLGEKRSKDLSLTRAGHVIGTLAYMAPERLRDKPLDGRSDIFAAGVVLYQLVSGQLPFSGDEAVMMQRILNEQHAPLSTKRKGCPPGLDAIVDRTLAKSPEDRYTTADELAADLATMVSEIRQEEAQQLMPEAKRLMDAQDLTRAREVLLQLLKTQTKHNTEARELLAGIQKQLSQRQREEKVQQIRELAEGLLGNKELDRCLAVLDEGLEIDPANVELTKLKQRVEKEKEKQKRIGDLLRQADAARREGDYTNALSLARKALKVDKSNTKGFALLTALEKEAQEAEKRAEVKALLGSARKELNARRYTEAIELLRKAEALDANNLELQLLMGDANAGLEQVRRGELIAQLETEVNAAGSLEQLQQASAAVREAIVAMPNESALVLLSGRVDRLIREQENRRFVDETVQTCRDLRPQQALALVQKARLRLPGDERLMALDGILTERVKQQSAEERRDEYLSQAREALSAGQFGDAVRILEGCQLQGIVTEEIASLLEFARHEEAEHRGQELLRNRMVQAQSLIGDLAFDEAIEFLEQALKEKEDPPLRMLLDQAVEGRESLKKQVETVLASAARLVRAGKCGEAIEFLEGQPATVRRTQRVAIAEAALKEDQQQAVFRMFGRAYSTLDNDLPAGDSTIRWVVAAFGEAEIGAPLGQAFQARAQASADRKIADLIARCKVFFRNRDRNGAASLIQEGTKIVDYAAPRVKADWASIVNEAGKAGVLGRGKRG